MVKYKFSLSLGIALALCFFNLAALAENSVSTQALSDDLKGFVGNEACLECHKAQNLIGPHGATTDKGSPASHHSCETCHGPGKEHAKFQEDTDGKTADPTLAQLRIGPNSLISAEDRNAICTDCHNSGGGAMWDGSIHERRDVSCVDCHSPHSRNQNYLRASSQSDLCSTCHKDVKAELQRTSHHPIREGKMQCSDCHNSHGTIADKLISANTVNEKCYECHADKRGPFLWEHAPAQENCTTCHTSHGSTHQMLLNAKLPFLCQSCHSEAGHPGTLYAIPAGSGSNSTYMMLPNRAFNQACMNCHVAVHGSNSPSGKSLGR